MNIRNQIEDFFVKRRRDKTSLTWGIFKNIAIIVNATKVYATENLINKWSRIMLNVYLGKMDEAVYYPPVYFDNRYEDEWIIDKRSIEIIRDVDKSDVVSAHLIESPVLGPISPKELSGGVKTILLMLFDETGRIFNASACGDNCAKWILKIAESKNLTINLRHIMEFGDEEFEMKILNTGEVVHNMLEFVNVAGLYV
nr:DUF4869 domain-containing protein [Blautia obeum]